MIIRMEELPEEITERLIVKMIERDQSEFKPRDDKLRRYFDGEHDIMRREFEDKTKPNNKIVTNFCKYITNTSVGYFIGEPIRYSSLNQEYMERLQEIFDENNEQEVNAKLAKYASIYARAAEILYAEEENGRIKIRFDALDPETQRVIFVYDTKVRPDLLMAVRYFECEDILTDKKTTHAFVYTRTHIYHFSGDQERLELQEEPREHFFGEVPLNLYFNKGEDGKGDFEDIITLNDAYNLLQSDDINESNYSNDAYLVISGLIAEDEDIIKMKERRVIELTGDGKSSAEWLIKEINDTWKENLKKRIKQDIHLVSGTPDMSDERFAGNISGVAIEYKLTPFENNRAAKERSFKRGLQRRIRLITNLLNRQGNNYDPNEIEISFSKNLPTDEEKIVNQVTRLLGTRLVSRDTLRSLIPWIEDAQLERQKIEAEEEVYTIDEALVETERTERDEENEIRQQD